MSPATHLMLGWLIGNADGLDRRRDRALVAVAGIIPDIDGFGVIAEALTKGSQTPLLWWSKYHHVLAHNLAFGVGFAVLTFAIAAKRRTAALLALLSFHIHLLGDIVGARGPDGDQWPIPYLQPFSSSLQLAWTHQWYLNAWPNFVISGAALLAVFYLAWERGYSPLEMISLRADKAFVEALRKRFPRENATDS